MPPGDSIEAARTRPPPCCFRCESNEQGRSGWLAPEESARAAIVLARSIPEVGGVLEALDCACAENRFAAAFFSYECAPAFDPAFRTRPPLGPLAGCLVFDTPPVFLERPPAGAAADEGRELDGDWICDTDAAAHGRAVAAIRARIAAGDTYQVNYTVRLRTSAPADPWRWFLARWRAQPVPWAAWLQTGDLTIAALSPELFFAVDGNEIRCRPMKGTAPRGRWPAEDAERRRALSASPKDRAENVMIVDMVRNDLGRIARPGSVRAVSLFDVEAYRTVFQMTSTVRAETRAPPSKILRALFPCASITGAPKISAMKIIAELETSPRGIYCGALGFVGPGRRMRFNVAIRTLAIRGNVAEYGVGGGVVWDSTAAGEYAEARAKALAVTAPDPPFELLETMRWRNGRVFLWREHEERLRASAAYFGFPPPDPATLRAAIADAAATAPPAGARIRLRYADDGAVVAEAATLPARSARPVILALDDRPTPSSSKWLFHKTTRREPYAAARARHPGADDVLLWNEDGEIMETTIANVFLRLGGRWYTPPIRSGLLAGTMRARLLARGWARERVLTPHDARAAERIALANSVRGLRPAILIPA